MSHPPPNLPPFHLAFPVHDLKAAKQFYANVLGCPIGRYAERWMDFNLWGHQIVAQLVDTGPNQHESTNLVHGHAVPASHFGIVLASRKEWESLADRLKEASINFLVPPHIRFEGESGEQGTFFICDPSNNALEFKYFIDSKQIFVTTQKP